MLDQVDLERSVSKQEYQQRMPKLQTRLYDIELDVIEARIPVLVVFEGWAGTSKIGTISTLTRRLDPRGIRIHPITAPRTTEQQYPWLHRFWLRTPTYGQIAIFDRSWYREILANRTSKLMTTREWHDRCEDITIFEQQLTDDGAVILKFYLHISKKEQGRRFEKLLANRVTAIQVTENDLWQHEHYKRVFKVTEDMLARTNTPNAPWIVVPASNTEYAQLMVLDTIAQTLEARVRQKNIRVAQEVPVLQEAGSPHYGSASSGNGTADVGGDTLPFPEASEGLAVALPPARGVLRRLDLSRRLDEAEYDQKLAKLQAKLYLLGMESYRQHRPVVLVFEGWDAAGKGGTIKRITERLDPRSYVVHSIAAPEGEDKQHHYLYRFWRRLPMGGQIAIFDRSWYGRVLVERIEGFARPDEWRRAYAEINEFERHLVDFGTIVCKFWLHVSREEQLRRFEHRQAVHYKAWKLTDEDWRNREKWPLYEQATEDMLAQTSTPCAPWMVVESEDKRYGRIKAIREIVRRLEDELGKVKL